MSPSAKGRSESSGLMKPPPCTYANGPMAATNEMISLSFFVPRVATISNDMTLAFEVRGQGEKIVQP
eukprot:scaffold1724_cov158-Amphora_coffeaeformis.AAC.4